MTCPFPGMDPFIEGQLWQDFHASFLLVIREMLMPQVRPRYFVEVEQYVYLAREAEDPDRRRRQAFLTIRNRRLQNVVTVIELLSPWNKAPGDGRSEYLVKRTNIVCTLAHLVELDLLRGGQRLPTREPLAPADFYAFVCRKDRLPQAEVYGWTVRDKLPTIPVPLAGDDPDVSLDLQAAFTTTYDRAGYDYALDYRGPVEPALDASAADWVRSIVERG
jgi:hypothetical protein